MELPRELSAKFVEDFAYPTIKDRIPVILTKVIDHVYRLKSTISEQYGQEGVMDVKSICGALSELKNRIQTDKPLTQISDDRDDVTIWNIYLAQLTQAKQHQPSWFKSPWLYTECFFYRKLMESIHQCEVMKDFDPFRAQKHEAFSASLSAITTLGEYLSETCDQLNQDNTKEYFSQFMQISLWGNKCDLSISAGKKNHQETNAVTQLNHLRPYILCDDTDRVLRNLVSDTNTTGRIDIVLDNAGFELFTDLCFAEFLLRSGLARNVHFHAKAMPWFVSDVTKEDFNWTIDQLSQVESTVIRNLAEKWQEHLQDGTWQFHAHKFWTLPHDFAQMQSVSPELYDELTKSSLIFFKGDLNYRKLTGDLRWKPTLPFEEALREFHPAALCTLRTLKCDLVVGLAEGVAEQTAAQDDNWMITGSWAVIQLGSIIDNPTIPPLTSQ